MLVVRDLHAHYGRAKILHGISFVLGAGEVIALLGRNGAGKSTTLKTIMNLVRPSLGSVIYRGEDISGWATHSVAKAGLGYVPEERRIFGELTVMENLEVGKQPPRDGAPSWTPERLFDMFPNLARMKSRQGARMSGGEQQMLTIARTLMGNPYVVLLDEPSEGLAPVIVERMAETIAQLKAEGLSVVLSEQNVHFAQIAADRAYVIEKGCIRHHGSMTEIAGNRELRQRYLSV
jgi:branched-chain amino acid transport system ATP-binding protein